MIPWTVDVLVIGEALVDVVVADGRTVEHPGGSPANVALGLGRLGIPTALLTDIGRDERGEAIAAHLRASGVRILPASRSHRRTSTATATIRPDGSADYDFDVSWDVAADPVGFEPRVIHTGSIAAFLDPGAKTVREHLRRMPDAIVTFDPNIRPALIGSVDATRSAFERMLPLCSVVKLSDEDARWLYPDRSLDEVLALILRAGALLAAVTLGADGSLLRAGSETAAVPAHPVDVVDTIGAGDTYMASLIASVLAVLAEPGPADLAALPAERLVEIADTAGRAAAITASRAGADLPTARELQDHGAGATSRGS
jgi:fructokinase